MVGRYGLSSAMLTVVFAVGYVVGPLLGAAASAVMPFLATMILTRDRASRSWPRGSRAPSPGNRPRRRLWPLGQGAEHAPRCYRRLSRSCVKGCRSAAVHRLYDRRLLRRDVRGAGPPARRLLAPLLRTQVAAPGHLRGAQRAGGPRLPDPGHHLRPRRARAALPVRPAAPAHPGRRVDRSSTPGLAQRVRRPRPLHRRHLRRAPRRGRRGRPQRARDHLRGLRPRDGRHRAAARPLRPRRRDRPGARRRRHLARARGQPALPVGALVRRAEPGLHAPRLPRGLRRPPRRAGRPRARSCCCRR